MPSVRCLLIFSVVFLLTACAGQRLASEPPMTSVSPASLSAKKPGELLPVSVLTTAREMLGVPYRYGGASPTGFDCSGLVSYAYRSVGIRVPRTSGEQFRQARTVSLQNLQAGDLLFFRLSPPKVSHVAIYDRSGRFIHAPSSGKQVRYASLDNPYWRKHLVGAGRF